MRFLLKKIKSNSEWNCAYPIVKRAWKGGNWTPLMVKRRKRSAWRTMKENGGV